MCRLLETIKCLDGKLQNLEFHQSRLEKSIREISGFTSNIKLTEEIETPDFAHAGLFRCRLIYHTEIEKIEFLPYQQKSISSLKVVFDDQIDYHLKFEDRSRLEFLFSQRGECDDIIIMKNGLVTDSFAANLVFFDGTKWWTPSTPLLPGTQRQQLLNSGKIAIRKIEHRDLEIFQKVGLINAMNSMENMPVIAIDKIRN